MRADTKRKTKQGSDPPCRISLSGEIAGEGTLSLDPCYRSIGEPDIPLDNPGEYRVRYLDGTGILLAETGFEVSFDPRPTLRRRS